MRVARVSSARSAASSVLVAFSTWACPRCDRYNLLASECCERRTLHCRHWHIFVVSRAGAEKSSRRPVRLGDARSNADQERC